MIETEDHEGVRVLRLAHGRASALDLELVTALRAALERAEADAVPAMVLTGTGHIFCAGVDLKRVVEGGADYVRRYLPAFRELMFALFSFAPPLVAAANGHAIAGGAVLVAAGDYRLMAAGEGRFGYTELRVGVPVPPAAMEIIRFGTPAAHRQAMLYTGATVAPELALARGCLDEVAPPADLLPRALRLARALGDIGPAFGIAKRHLRGAALRRLHEAERIFADEVAAVWCAEETQRCIRDYLAATLRRR